MYEMLNWLHIGLFLNVYYDCPWYLKPYLIPYRSSYSLRHLQFPFFFVPRIFSEAGRRSFQYKAPSDWNNLPQSLRSVTSLYCFR